MSIPSDVAPDAGSFVVSSSSKYTSGASIAGVLTIHCEFYNDGNFYLEATEHTTGETSFEINLKNDLLVTDSSFDIDLTCGATYIDDFTRKTAKAATVTAIIHKFKYRIEYDSKQNNIKPGLPFEFTLNVLKFDGSPANQDPRRKRDIQEVAVSITFGDSESETHYPLDSMGHAQVTVDVPENASNLRITVSTLYF